MASIKYKTLIILASSVLCTLYIFSMDRTPVDTGSDRYRDFVYLPSDIAKMTLVNETEGQTITGGCILMDRYSPKRKPADFRVIVLTYNRPFPLWRLLESLEEAHYEGDNVVFEIWLDRSKSNTVHNETFNAAREFRFTKGICHVFVHPVHVGITGQWLTTWYPTSSSSEIAVILEDDLTVSPYFYSYLKLVHRKYSKRHDIYGFSLQGKNVRHSDGECCLEVPTENKVFLYPTLGTSGFSPNNRNWAEFISWYKIIKRANIPIPLPENHISTSWYLALSGKGKEDSMWEMEYLYYTRQKKEYTLYPNFEGNRGLTFNWMEDGLHSTGLRITIREEELKHLVRIWNLQLEQLPDNPVYLDDSGAIVR